MAGESILVALIENKSEGTLYFCLFHFFLFFFSWT